MPEEDKITYIDKLLGERNFLSAYLFLKEASLKREVELEYTGKIVQDILNEIGYSSGRRDREKVFYYRSLLLMIFEDVPGFARIYRKQLRLALEPESPLAFLKQLRNLTSLSADKEDIQESIKDTIEDISEKIEDTTEDIKDGRLDDSMQDLLSFAEESIKDGLKGFNDFLKKITTPSQKTDIRQEKDEKKMRQAEPIENEKSTEKEENKPGNKDDE